MNPTLRTNDGYLTGFVLFACLLAITLVYLSSALSLYRGWTAENSLQSHGLLLLPVSIYLLAREWYTSRSRLVIGYRPVFWVLLGLCSMAWLLTDIAKIQLLSQVLLILMLWLVVPALFGLSGSARMGIPILILLSATPGWSVLAQPLQEPTAYLVNQMLQLTGYTSYQEGFLITIPEGVFEVGDTCSGLRYQIAALTLAIIYAFVSGYTWIGGAVYLLLASGVAFLSNAIRIYIVVLSGHYTNMTHSLLEDHIWLGWVVFAICYAVFMLLTLWIENRFLSVRQKPADGPAAVASSRLGVVPSLLIGGIVLLSASTGPLYRYVGLDMTAPVVQSEDSFQLSLPGMTEVAGDRGWQPHWINPDAVVRSRYRLSRGAVDFFAAYYAEQDQGKEVVSDLNYAYSPGEWRIESQSEVTFSLPDGRKLPVREEQISQTSGNKRVLWNWYYVGGYVTSSSLKAKLFGMLSGLQGRRDAAVVVISSAETGSAETSRIVLQEFVEQAIGEIEQRFRLRSAEDTPISDEIN
ncbi:MAG: exosortase C-terminal domain/associated protein EpsI [Candidatus Thiodiazotropha sp.]